MQLAGEKYSDVEDIWDKLFKNGPSKICGRQPLKNFTWSIPEYFVPNMDGFKCVDYKKHCKWVVCMKIPCEVFAQGVNFHVFCEW